MLKLALLASAVILAASTAAVEMSLPEAAAPASELPCRIGASTGLACAMGAANIENRGGAAELADLPEPAAPVDDWTPLHPEHDSGLDFRDAAVEPRSMLSRDRERPQPLVPALIALGGLVILLRRRPT